MLNLLIYLLDGLKLEAKGVRHCCLGYPERLDPDSWAMDD
jgi:hypothetical protein